MESFSPLLSLWPICRWTCGNTNGNVLPLYCQRAEGHFERCLRPQLVLFRSTLEPRSLSLWLSSSQVVPWLFSHSAAVPGHAPAPARCPCLSMGCNHGQRGCGGTKACHMLSGQLRSLLEGRDMGKGVLQNAVASHFPQSECSCVAKAQVHHTCSPKHQSLLRSYSSP